MNTQTATFSGTKRRHDISGEDLAKPPVKKARFLIPKSPMDDHFSTSGCSSSIFQARTQPNNSTNSRSALYNSSPFNLPCHNTKVIAAGSDRINRTYLTSAASDILSATGILLPRRMLRPSSEDTKPDKVIKMEDIEADQSGTTLVDSEQSFSLPSFVIPLFISLMR